MIQLNKYPTIPIVHKCDPERTGEIMTKQEMHEFGIDLLIVYLYNQKGNLISTNNNLSNEYPHILVENPKEELLYIWVKTEIYPIIPSVKSIENREEVTNPHAAGIDVGSRSHWVAVGQRENEIREYGVFNEDLFSLTDWLKELENKLINLT